MEWTKEYAYKILESNPKFIELKNEWLGDYMISYDIDGNEVLISNTVGGFVQSYIVPPFNKDTIYDACDFAIIAKDILQELINKKNLV